MIRFKTDFRAEDYSELCWFQTKHISMLLSVLIALALGFTALGITHRFFWGIVVLALALPVSFTIQKRSVVKRADRRYGAFGASSELYLEIDNDEIRQTAASGDTRLTWSDVYAVRESENCYYVFLSKRKAFYFPKRSFENIDAQKAFLEIIKDHVPAKKIKLKK